MRIRLGRTRVVRSRQVKDEGVRSRSVEDEWCEKEAGGGWQ